MLYKNKQRNRIYKTRVTRVIIVCLFVLAFYIYYKYNINDNFSAVIENKIYRSAQPETVQLEKWIEEYNLKTVVNLRGPTAAQADDETRLCEDKDINILNVKLNAYKKIPSHRLIELLDAIEKIETPVLLHCNHGVDRSGTASALTSWILGFEPYEKAKKHSYVIPGPWKYRNGLGQHISQIFNDYEKYCTDTNHQVDDADYFKSWARDIYHPDYFYVGYDAKDVIYAASGNIAEFKVTVTNLSGQIIPAGEKDRRFRLFSRITKDSEILEPKDRYATETLLHINNLKPGEKTNIVHKLQSPVEPGTYEFYIDLLEKEDHSFARQGCPVFEGSLVVLPIDENHENE